MESNGCPNLLVKRQWVSPIFTWVSPIFTNLQVRQKTMGVPNLQSKDNGCPQSSSVLIFLPIEMEGNGCPNLIPILMGVPIFPPWVSQSFLFSRYNKPSLLIWRLGLDFVEPLEDWFGFFGEQARKRFGPLSEINEFVEPRLHSYQPDKDRPEWLGPRKSEAETRLFGVVDQALAGHEPARLVFTGPAGAGKSFGLSQIWVRLLQRGIKQLDQKQIPDLLPFYVEAPVVINGFS